MLDMTMGINHQARAIAAFLERNDGIESSWDDSLKQYRARVQVAPWYNGRERGLVFWVTDSLYKASGTSIIAVFEHRNTDQIHAIEWEQDNGYLLNPPTLADVPEGVYRDKWSTSFSVKYGEIAKMAEHILERFDSFCKQW